MKIIVSPDSFKGSCSAIEVADSIEKAIHSVDSTIEVVKMPVADGGEGTIDVFRLPFMNWKYVTRWVKMQWQNTL